jgi:hypothetical protein
MGVPIAERVNRIRDRQLSDYEVGVATTLREVQLNVRLHLIARSILWATLVWLAVSPALRSRVADSETRPRA